MKHRKKAVVIEAMQLPPESEVASQQELAEWLRSHDAPAAFRDSGNIEIHTLEGLMIAKPGDYIIKGVKGEFYSCKPDIFEMTYERDEVSDE